MVFFTCNHCGESVKKPSVEKHYNTKCRGATKNVTCMDCLKDFHAEEYVAHTKCISEAQKYSGKDYVAKESKNANAKKQESWTEVIRQILHTPEYNLSATTRNAFQRLENAENVPRKKAKFENFVANCIRMTKPQATEVWNVLEIELAKLKQSRQEAAAAVAKAKQSSAANDEEITAKENGVSTPAKSIKGKTDLSNEIDEPAKKKSKKEETIEFEWAAEVQKIVAKHAGGITVENLKKKLQKKYAAELQTEELNVQQQKILHKKCLKSLRSPMLQVTDELVTYKPIELEQPLTNGIVENGTKNPNENSIEPAQKDEDESLEWTGVLEQLVAKNANGITLAKVQSKLLKKYLATLGIDALTKEQQNIFDMKLMQQLKSCASVEVIIKSHTL